MTSCASGTWVPEEGLGRIEARAMGMGHTVRFTSQEVPPLPRVLAVLAEHNFPVQVRMVDGELTLPDEAPPGDWRDVRLGTAAGMVTLVRRGQELAVVIWGNADDALRCAWNAIAWAAARAGEGWIVGPSGPQNPDEFRRGVSLPNVLKA